jgi:hypothetical protein
MSRSVIRSQAIRSPGRGATRRPIGHGPLAIAVSAIGARVREGRDANAVIRKLPRRGVEVGSSGP